MKTVEDKNGASSFDLKRIGPALKSRQSHTIEYKVIKIVK